MCFCQIDFGDSKHFEDDVYEFKRGGMSADASPFEEEINGEY